MYNQTVLVFIHHDSFHRIDAIAQVSLFSHVYLPVTEPWRLRRLLTHASLSIHGSTNYLYTTIARVVLEGSCTIMGPVHPAS
jgi:hypothetical protein